MFQTIKQILVIAFAGLFSGSILVACGGGGEGADE